MNALFDRHCDQITYNNGERVAYSVKIDEFQFAQLVYPAAKNKSGRSKLLGGALIIEAKKLPRSAA